MKLCGRRTTTITFGEPCSVGSDDHSASVRAESVSVPAECTPEAGAAACLEEPASKSDSPCCAFSVSGNFVYVPSNVFRDTAGNAIAKYKTFRNAASIDGSGEEDK
jgi:hypothetical protein